MPCDGYTKGVTTKLKKECFQHLSGDEANQFISSPQGKLMEWGSVFCIIEVLEQ